MGTTTNSQEEAVRMHAELVQEWKKGKSASEDKVKSLLALLKVSWGLSFVPGSSGCGSSVLEWVGYVLMVDIHWIL